MIDGEGHVSIRHRKSIDRIVRIANTDQDILDAIVRCCDVLGISTVLKPMHQKLDERHKLVCYEVAIYGRKNFQTLYESVPIQSTRKRETLEQIVNSYTYPVRPCAGELDLAYNEKKLSINEIARIYRVSQTTAYQWLVKKGVVKRPKEPGGVPLRWNSAT